MNSTELAALFEKTEERVSHNVRELLDQADERGFRLDRTLLTLSGGALALSITLITRANPPKTYLCILFLSWIALAGSVVGVVFALRKSQSSAESDVDRAASVYKELKQKKQKILAGEITYEESKEVFPLRDIEICNRISLWGFVVGIILLGLFAALNLATK
jgi:hypothetical protein